MDVIRNITNALGHYSYKYQSLHIVDIIAYLWYGYCELVLNYGRNNMFKSKFNLTATLIILLVSVSTSGIAEKQQYTPEMVENCLKLADGIDTSDWLIDKELAVLDDSKLNTLDDGWNMKIEEAHQKMLKICNVNNDSDECLLAKQPERKLKQDRRKCYYRILMRSI